MNNLFIVTIYLLFLIGFYYFSNSKTSFKAKTNWWTNGLSLFAVNFSISTPLLISGIYHNEGIGGLWILWSGYLVSGFAPFVFAPLWAKLNFITDNQFITFRFSGKSAKILHQFRAIYVGFFIVAFLICFQTLSILKVLSLYTQWSKETIFTILTILLILIAFKNQLNINLKLDKLHIYFILIIFLITAVNLYQIGLGHQESIILLSKNTPNLNSIFPKNSSYLYILFFVQTWSVQLFDGSGVDAQRYFSQKDKKSVWKIALLNTSLHLIFNILIVIILLYGSAKFPILNLEDKEIYIISYLQKSAGWLNPLLLIAFIACFISSFTGLLNWGASFLSIDIYKTYIKKNSTNKQQNYIAIIASVLITLVSVIFTYYIDSLEMLVKLLFSISAGVFPVFVLRWFWFKINAWSQISAMLSSAIFTLYYKNFIVNSNFKTNICLAFNLNDYSFQLLFVTVLTTFTWVLVTFLTKKDNHNTIKNFKKNVLTDFNIKQSVFYALLFGVCITLLFISILHLILN